MNEPKEFSESGNPIYRYEKPKEGFEFAIGDAENIAAVEKHIETFVGKPKTVFHEVISHLVHIDVHVVEPTKERPYYTLVTSGMSDRPMNTPAEFKQFSHAELMLCLPQNWPVSQKAFEQEANYWPVKLLKFLARFPHQFNSWLYCSHTLPNGNPPDRFANSDFCCALLGWPQNFPKEFRELKVTPEKTVRFFSVLPIYQEEMDMKLKQGVDAVWSRFEKAGITELLDLHRKNVAKKFLGIF